MALTWACIQHKSGYNDNPGPGPVDVLQYKISLGHTLGQNIYVEKLAQQTFVLGPDVAEISSLGCTQWFCIMHFYAFFPSKRCYKTHCSYFLMRVYNVVLILWFWGYGPMICVFQIVHQLLQAFSNNNLPPFIPKTAPSFLSILQLWVLQEVRLNKIKARPLPSFWSVHQTSMYHLVI